jgi:hypothetical protein
MHRDGKQVVLFSNSLRQNSASVLYVLFGETSTQISGTR